MPRRCFAVPQVAGFVRVIPSRHSWNSPTAQSSEPSCPLPKAARRAVRVLVVYFVEGIM
ncbi:hypothetical protein RB213_000238 [Colletotrichum asianum]